MPKWDSRPTVCDYGAAVDGRACGPVGRPAMRNPGGGPIAFERVPRDVVQAARQWAPEKAQAEQGTGERK